MLLIDGFIKNQKLLDELKKDLHWANIPTFNWWDGWWKVKPRNIWETTIEIIWKNLIKPEDKICGFEYWASKVTEKVKEGIVFTTFHFPEHMVNMVTGHGKDEETMCAEYKVSAVEVQKISNQFKTEVSTEKNQSEVTKTLIT